MAVDVADSKVVQYKKKYIYILLYYDNNNENRVLKFQQYSRLLCMYTILVGIQPL